MRAQEADLVPVLYHFSEDPTIPVFVPHRARTSDRSEELVWAIDDRHAPMYYVPRDCPRACFWPGPQTTAADRRRWFDYVDARMVIVVESGWLDRLRATSLYRYTMPATTFDLLDATAGHWVSRETVTPLAVEPVGDLLAALAGAGVELRLTPSLIPLWSRIIRSTLEFSGTRLRNALGYEALSIQGPEGTGTIAISPPESPVALPADPSGTSEGYGSDPVPRRADPAHHRRQM
jgi:Family of unknown function (DUF6886)